MFLTAKFYINNIFAHKRLKILKPNPKIFKFILKYITDMIMFRIKRSHVYIAFRIIKTSIFR